MDVFPLFQLPIVARTYALKLLDPVDLFELSLCSKNAARIVKELRVEAELHGITLTRGQCMISVKFGHGKRMIWWDFKCFQPIEELKEQRTIGGVVFRNCDKLRQNAIGIDEFYCEYANTEEGMAAVSKHLTDIFPGPLHVQLTPQIIGRLGELLSHEHFSVCKILELSGNRQIGETAMRQIFDNLRVEHRLTIFTETDELFSVRQALKVDELQLEDCRWMSRHDLLALNCRMADLRNHCFTSADLESFAAFWQRSSSTRLERVRFGWEPDVPFSLSPELKTTSWQPDRRERHFIFDEDGLTRRRRLNCGAGVDLEKTDGSLLATFVRDNDPLTPAVHFVVWHERFPERRRLDNLPKVLAPYYTQLEELSRIYRDSSSLERMLANPQLKFDEFVETYRVLRGMDSEYRPASVGRTRRRAVFDRIYTVIGIDENREDELV